MSTTSFIPSVWSETLAQELDKEYIGVRNCNREFEGEIREKGSSVTIGSIGYIGIEDYEKDMTISTPQNVLGTQTTLRIDQAKAFNFQIDDLDRIQSSPKLMKAAVKKAASALANVADYYVYSLYSSASERITINEFDSDKVIDTLVGVRKKLLANGVTSNYETSFEVTPEVAAEILRAKILTDTDNTESFHNGHLGKLIGFDIYVSHNVANVENRHKCIARTKRAVAFAEQINEVEAYRPHNRFADAVKGLHLYGATLVYPSEFVLVDIGF